MDLALTEEQQSLVGSVSALLGSRSQPEVVRKAEDIGFDSSLWAQLQEFGVVAMAASEAAGGWGAEFVDLCLLAEQLGAFLAPAPVVEVQCATRLLAAIPADVAAALAPLLAGDSLVTLAVRPARSGSASLVPAGSIADAAIVRADDRLLYVELDDSNRRTVANLASAPLADIEIAGGRELVAGPAAVAAYECAVDDWLVLTAAALVGSAAVALRMTCDYAVVRHSWGTPIGLYQGVAHPLADSATAIDGARLLVRKAAWAIDTDDPRRAELAAMAFAFAAETARDVTYAAVHLHGGVGFTLEHDAQLHYRRVRGWARVWGEPRDALLRAASQRYGESA